MDKKKRFHMHDYIWNIFEIAAYNDIDDINLAFDMFVINLDYGVERYKGSSYINTNFEDVSSLWNTLEYSVKEVKKATFKRIIYKYYPLLYDCFRNHNKSKFDEIIAKTTKSKKNKNP